MKLVQEHSTDIKGDLIELNWEAGMRGQMAYTWFVFPARNLKKAVGAGNTAGQKEWGGFNPVSYDLLLSKINVSCYFVPLITSPNRLSHGSRLEVRNPALRITLCAACKYFPDRVKRPLTGDGVIHPVVSTLENSFPSLAWPLGVKPGQAR